MSKKPKVGERKVMECAITGKPTLMEYVGECSSGNGHPGWLCLHE